MARATTSDQFILTYEAKCPKASNCLLKDRASLMTVYDFPAVHWQHLRTTNPIESMFATIRHRTTQMKGTPQGVHFHPTESWLWKTGHNDQLLSMFGLGMSCVDIAGRV